MKLKIGILYISLHNQLKKKAGIRRCLTRKQVYEKLGRHFLIPKNLKDLVIKEMEQQGFIEVQNHNLIIIKPCEIDLKKDANKLYEKVGFH